MSGAVDKVTGVYSERHIWRKLTFEYGVKEYGIWNMEYGIWNMEFNSFILFTIHYSPKTITYNVSSTCVRTFCLGVFALKR